MRIIFTAIFVALIVNIASAEILESGSIVCETKEAIIAARSALDNEDTKKHQELLTSGRCYLLNGRQPVAITNNCKNSTGEIRKIIMNGNPMWCLSSQLK